MNIQQKIAKNPQKNPFIKVPVFFYGDKSHFPQKSEFGAGNNIKPEITVFHLYKLENQYGRL